MKKIYKIGAETREPRSALDKALAVLEVVASHPQSIGLPDVTALLELPRQTVHRVLQQLESNGLVLRDPKRERFSIGPRFSRLALIALSSSNQTASVRAILSDLVDDVRESCNVGVLDGLEFHYLERVDCQWALRVHLQAGNRVPAYCTSAGKVMMAHLPRNQSANLIKVSALKRYTDNTLTKADKLQAEFAAIRENGFALNDQEYAVGIIGVAVPIFDSNGRVLSALAFHGPQPRFSIERARKVVPKLQAAAQRLSGVWGLQESADKTVGIGETAPDQASV